MKPMIAGGLCAILLSSPALAHGAAQLHFHWAPALVLGALAVCVLTAVSTRRRSKPQKQIVRVHPKRAQR